MPISIPPTNRNAYGFLLNVVEAGGYWVRCQEVGHLSVGRMDNVLGVNVASEDVVVDRETGFSSTLSKMSVENDIVLATLENSLLSSLFLCDAAQLIPVVIAVVQHRRNMSPHSVPWPQSPEHASLASNIPTSDVPSASSKLLKCYQLPIDDIHGLTMIIVGIRSYTAHQASVIPYLNLIINSIADYDYHKQTELFTVQCISWEDQYEHLEPSRNWGPLSVSSSLVYTTWKASSHRFGIIDIIIWYNHPVPGSVELHKTKNTGKESIIFIGDLTVPPRKYSLSSTNFVFGIFDSASSDPVQFSRGDDQVIYHGTASEIHSVHISRLLL
ncbi:hypothetical protein F5146DRAFT_995616 [Armillaria mellea]|nr:hypothetical protein F5146DRAFT_995616 [Armillaria mellea]